MILTISTTHRPATDLGYLLHKNPATLQTFSASFGEIHVFYPEASVTRCTAALLLGVDPVGLVRGRKGPPGQQRALEQYVNDRPYVASSFMSVAIGQAFGTAMAGRSKERPDLAATPIPVVIEIAVLPCKSGEPFLRGLFEPLGYQVEVHQYPLDEQFPEWGASRYFRVKLTGQKRISEVLSHLYVLIPVLDDDKHYWVGTDEVDKLVAKGAGWLPEHPEKQAITHRYLSHKKSLTAVALERLLDEESETQEEHEALEQQEAVVEERIKLNDLRLGAVMSVLKACGARRVADLGCGEGRLLRLMMSDTQFEQIVGMDVSYRVLETAARRLKLDRLAPIQKAKLQLFQGSLIYRDQRLEGFDAAAVIEVIEHLDAARLAAFESVVFGAARPGCVVITTPNVEYNVRFATLPAGAMRHKDHRFEWNRTQFESWSAKVAERFEYAVRFVSVGPLDLEVGPPTQMAVFTK